MSSTNDSLMIWVSEKRNASGVLDNAEKGNKASQYREKEGIWFRQDERRRPGRRGDGEGGTGIVAYVCGFATGRVSSQGYLLF